MSSVRRLVLLARQADRIARTDIDPMTRIQARRQAFAFRAEARRKLAMNPGWFGRGHGRRD